MRGLLDDESSRLDGVYGAGRGDRLPRRPCSWRSGWALACFAVAGGAAVLTRYWSRTHPGPMPHLLRWTLYVPRGNQSSEHLKRILEPRSGERILEIGPGIGIHALPVASSLARGGTLDVLDVQQAMLDDLM